MTDLRSEPFADQAEALEAGAGQPDPKDDSLAIRVRAHALAVTDQATLDLANGFLKEVKRVRRELDATFDPHIKKAVEAHKALLAEKRRFTDKLDQAEADLKPKIAAYLYQKDQEALAAARARALAEKKVELTTDQAIDKAHELVEAGRPEAADQVLKTALADVEQIQAATPEAPEKPAAEGLQLRTTWEFEIENEAQLPREFLKPDLVKIGQVVRALKDQAKIAGVRTFPKRSVAARIG